jgi:WD40 repeat protein/serine/threonine protein kinase
MDTERHSTRLDPFDELVEEYLGRRRRGERPTPAEYAARYPDFAPRILEFFPALELIEQLKPTPEDRAGDSDGTGSDGPSGGGPGVVIGDRLQRLGDFRVLREIGRGGMGVVYEAEQESLGRRVALKVMSGHRLSDPTQLARFTREAKAAARLHHTNIVPVFGVGQEEGVHYYVMQFIQGQGLDAVLSELKRLEMAAETPTVTRELRPGEISAAAVAQSLIAGTFSGVEAQTAHYASGSAVSSGLSSSDSLDFAVSSGSSLVISGKSAFGGSVARIGLQAAEGLAYAHEQGILHRDIKPSNLLLDAQGIVWITDFGLAKATTDSDLTHTGDILGTIRYMAPERFQGRCDAGADVYALGLTLYELLAKRPAFDEADRGKLIKQVTDTEPPPLRTLDRTITRDLATIVHKAIEREPTHRYRSADDLADDLRRFLEDRPIAARQITTTEQVWRWCKRNPLAAALAGSLLTTLVAGLVVVSVLLIRLWAVAGERSRLYLAELERSTQLSAETRTARAAEETARTAEELANRRLYIARMNQMSGLWENWNGKSFFQTLAEQLPENQAGVDRRGWEWSYWQRKGASGHITLRGHTGPVLKVAFSADGTRILSAGQDGSVRVWDAADGQSLLTLSGLAAFATSVAFSSDGKRIAFASDDRTIRVCDVRTEKVLSTLTGHTRPITDMAFNHEGTRIASVSFDQTVRVWNAAGGNEIHTMAGHSDSIYGVTFSPDGTCIASVGEDATVRLWDAVTGHRKRSLAVTGDTPCEVSFSPDGNRIASATLERGMITVWDVATGHEMHTFKAHTRWVHSMAISPEGKRIASGGDQSVRVWDAATGQELLTLKGHTGELNSVVFSPDGTRIASASDDGTVRVWDARAGQETLKFHGHKPGFQRVAFSPDGTRIASAGWHDRTLRLWDTATGQELLTLRGFGSPIRCVAFSPDGTRLATAGYWTVRVFDVASGHERLALGGHPGLVFDVAFSPDGTRIASADGDGSSVKLWDSATGRLIHTLQGNRSVRGVAFSPDGARIGCACYDGAARIFDVVTGQEVATLHGHSANLYRVEFSPDGTRIASASWDQTVIVWDLATKQKVLTLTGHSGVVYHVAFSPDGTRIASASGDGSIKVWEAATGLEVLTLKGGPDELGGLAFSPDATRIASGGASAVKIWDAREATPQFMIVDEARAWATYLVDHLASESEVRDHISRDKARRAEVRATALNLVRGFWKMRIDRRAEETVEPLLSRLLLREDVLAALRSHPATDPEIQAACLKLAESWGESSMDCDNAARSLIREPGRSSAIYERGLRLARAACRQEPGIGNFLSTLGMAQFRLGFMPEALGTLTRSNAFNQGKMPADLAFLAMAHQRLGQSAEARAMLGRLRELMRTGDTAGGRPAESRAFLAESEAAVLYDPGFPEHPFSH